TVVAVLSALAPAATPALAIIRLLAGEIATLAPIIGPLVTTFGRLLQTALTPLMPVLTNLAKAIVPPLVETMQNLAPLIPIIGGAFADLVTAVVPLLPVFAQLIAAILPPLVQFIDALVRDGIGPLVQALVVALQPVLPVI